MDLARLAGLHPSGVICEIMKDDGTMARLPDLIPFCQKHDLPLVTVADLVAYRLRKDPIISHLSMALVETAWGEVKVDRFASLLDGSVHFALVHGGSLGPRAPGAGPPGGPARRPPGLRPESPVGLPLGHGRHRQGGPRASWSTCGATPRSEASVGPTDREVGIGAQILGNLGIREMRLLSRSEKKYIGLRGFGLDIVAHVHMDAP